MWTRHGRECAGRRWAVVERFLSRQISKVETPRLGPSWLDPLRVIRAPSDVYTVGSDHSELGGVNTCIPVGGMCPGSCLKTGAMITFDAADPGLGSHGCRTLADLLGLTCSRRSRQFGVCSHCHWERIISIKSTGYASFADLFPLFPLFLVEGWKESTERGAISMTTMAGPGPVWVLPSVPRQG